MVKKVLKYKKCTVYTHPQVMLSVVEQKPDLAITVREKYFLQGDDIRMLQLSQ